MTDKNNKPQLSIIKGDLPVSPLAAGGDFVMAEATDTRLMGVVGLHIIRNGGSHLLHQFLYLDFEEYGIEDYQWTREGGPAVEGFDFSEKERNPEDIKRELFGGLGGNWREINEREALYLAREAMSVNISRENALADGYPEYAYLLENDPGLNDDQIAALWGKICKVPDSPEELINYFYMRMVGKDLPAVEFLCAPGCTVKPIDMATPGSLFMNNIERPSDQGDINASTQTYLVTSLVEDDISYRDIYSKVTVSKTKVVSMETSSDMEISFWEMSIIMRQPEFLLHGIARPHHHMEDLEDFVTRVFPTAAKYDHEEGDLYMIFRRDNKHVDSKKYRLDHDVIATLYFSHRDEVLVAGYSPHNVNMVYDKLREKFMTRNISLSEAGRYQFPSATLVAYIDKGFSSFREYLNYLKEFEG